MVKEYINAYEVKDQILRTGSLPGKQPIDTNKINNCKST